MISFALTWYCQVSSPASAILHATLAMAPGLRVRMEQHSLMVGGVLPQVLHVWQTAIVRVPQPLAARIAALPFRVVEPLGQ